MKCQLLVSVLAVAMVLGAVDSMTVSNSLGTRPVGRLELASGGGAGSDNDNARDRSALVEILGLTRNKRSSKSVEERAIDRQVKELRRLKCKPHLKKIFVVDQLEGLDERKEKIMIPQILAVERCLTSCSYCGDSLGMERKQCVSVEHEIRTFTVRYYDLGKPQYLELPIRVDTKCRCQ